MRIKRNCKPLTAVISAVAVILAICGAVTLFFVINERKLAEKQDEALLMLEERKGDYDEHTIMLPDTSYSEAKALAEKLDAKLRISKNGKFATLTFPDDVSVRDVYADPENKKHIRSFSPDFKAETSEIDPEAGNSEERKRIRLPSRPVCTVTDSEYGKQTYFDYLNMKDVWNFGKGSGITVAVIDTGIDTDHPEFAGRISEYSYNASEDKIVKDYTKEDGSLDWSLVEDETGHGTAVAGVIAASMNEGNVTGISPEVTVIAIKAECDEQGRFKRTSDLVFGLYYAIERNAKVVNMSFGVSLINPFANAARLAVDDDIVCVAAAGNESTALPHYPAADENVIGVGALKAGSMELADYSDYGENVDIVAPGTTYTTNLNGKHKSMDGTSLSCPLVSGAVALYMSRNGYAEFEEVKGMLCASAYDLGDKGPDMYYGYGALDVYEFVCGERGKVKFDMMTDELENTEQTYIKGHVLMDIPEPERLYSVFDGWYYDIDCTEELKYYDDIFNTDITLYAKWANEDDGVPYTYAELDDGTIEIRSYTGRRRYITVPDKIDGREVSSIGVGAFANEKELREVGLPKYLKTIREGAFKNCVNLLHEDIPDGVTNIGAEAFGDNSRLSYVAFGAGSALKKIGRFAFKNCGRLTEFELPAATEETDGSAFFGTVSMRNFKVREGNDRFVSVDGALYDITKSEVVAFPAGRTAAYEIPKGVTDIGDYAFGFARLKTADLNSVLRIGAYAFASSRIESIVIPDSVASTGDGVFSDCAYLTEVKLGGGLSSVPNKAFSNCRSLKSIYIPRGVRTIGKDAFFKAISLETLGFAEDSGLVQINKAAFFMNVSLKSVRFPKSLVFAGAESFCKSGLERVLFEEGSQMQTIGENAFASSYSLSEVVLPKGLREIGDYAFSNTNLSTVSVPEKVEYLGAGVFSYCRRLTDVFVDEGNKYYADVGGVVYDKKQSEIHTYPAGNARTSYEVLSGTEKIGEAAFEGSLNLQTASLPEGLLTVGKRGFHDCANIRYYNLPSSVEYIEEYAFAGNTNLGSSFYVPDSVRQISRYAFAYDRNLYEIRFGQNSALPRISFGSFAYVGLRSFEVPANVSTMAQHAFTGCENLNSVSFAKGSKLESISAFMFLGCDNLQSIAFGEGSSLKSIQAHGFEGMTNLQSVDFGDSELCKIGNYAFRFDENLDNILLPEGAEYIGRYAFYGCKKLTGMRIPASMDFIGENAFYKAQGLDLYFAANSLPANLRENWDNGIRGYYVGVTDVTENDEWRYAALTGGGVSVIEYKGSEVAIDLTKLDFGGDVVSVGGHAFEGKKIENIILPQTLNSIYRSAFERTSLKSVSIPDGVTVIGRNAFRGSGINAVEFGENSALETMEQSAFEHCKSLSFVKLPKSLKTLGRRAFSESGLSGVDIANCALTEIPEGAFMKTKLKEVILPDCLNFLGHNAFRDCESLESVSFGTGKLRLGSNAFYNTGLKSLYIPANLEYIGEYGFVGLRNLNEFRVDANNAKYTAADGLLYSKDGRKLISAPAGRTGEITLPRSLEELGFGAFENSKLTKIHFHPESNILTFGYRCFFNSDITEFDVPESVVSIDFYAFARCSDLQRVTFANGSGLRGIYEGAFYGCESLNDIEIPDGIVEISDFAFYGCSSLAKIPISETSSVKGIYDYAFAHTGIKVLRIPETLYDIGEYAFKGLKIKEAVVPDAHSKELFIGFGAFADCNELEEITLPFIGESTDPLRNTWLGYIFGAGSHKANNTYVPKSLKTVTISEGVDFIGQYAFYELINLESVNVPNTVTTLYRGAFEGNRAIYELKNPVILRNIDCNGNDVIYPCAEGDYFGHGISGQLEFSNNVTSIGCEFSSCSGLTSITIPDSVISIGGYAFKYCDSLTSVTIGNGVTSIGNWMFNGCTSLTSVKIGNGVTSIGDSAFWWCSSLTSITIPVGVKSIGNQAFYSCDSLTSITIPDSVTSIGGGAFSDCRSLTSITIPDSVTSIGDGVFWDCSSLTSITIPDKVTSIGDGAFKYCQKLYEIKNNSALPFSIGSEDYGGIAQYAKVIISADGTKQFKDDEDFIYIDTPDGFKFSFYNGEYELLAYIGTKKTITLPMDINGNIYTMNGPGGLRNVIIPDGVTSIGDRAFDGCSSLKSITIPDSVTSIGDWAFNNCSGLTSITIPDGVTNIGAYAYDGCRSLTSITIPDSVTNIGAYAFDGCSGLTSITIPDSVTCIEGCVFSGCRSLTSITIPDGVTSIGWFAFHGCSDLTSITIPDNVTSIGGGAFEGCDSLTSITIPAGVTSIERGAISSCKNLTCIVVDENNPKYFVKDGILYVKESETNKSVIFVPKNVTYVEIPNDVTSIGYNVFGGCSNLMNITIPDSVTSIGASAFWDCTSLTSITIPDSVTSIGDHAFYNCSNLTSVTIGKGITSIGGGAFMNCNSLISITIPNGVTSIGYGAFSGCRNLVNIVVDIQNPKYFVRDGVLYQKDDEEKVSIVAASMGITDVQIPDGVTSIGDSAFDGCSSLTSITIPDSVTSIGSFWGCSSLTSITIPNGVTSIGTWAFLGCSSLTSITIPDSVTSIGDEAFYGCSSLTCITIPDSVMSIGYGAFWGCSGLTSITIPNSVTSIRFGTFGGCRRLYEVINKSSLSFSMGSEDYGGVAQHARVIISADGTKQFKDDENFIYIDTPDGFRFSFYNGKYELIAYIGTEETVTLPTDINGNTYTMNNPVGLCNVIIPNGVTSIRDNAFQFCSSLTSIAIPASVTSIGEDAFEGCSSLTSIAIPDSVTSIGWGAFEGCSGLTSINIPAGVTSIGGRAFCWCSSLMSIIIPDGVTSIGQQAFLGCSSLTSITIPDSVTSIGWYAFYGCSSLTGINIPSGVTNIGNFAFRGCSSLTSIVVDEHNPKCFVKDGVLYQKDDEEKVSIVVASKEITNVQIPDSVTSIGEDVFEGCSSLTSITIGCSVTSIGDYAFKGCSGLTSITIPDRVTSIGNGAFSGCSGLTSITIPNGVINIGSSAFVGTSYYDNFENWVDGCLYIGNHLIKVNTNMVECSVNGTIAYDALEGCYEMRKITISKCLKNVLASLTNLETLILTKSPETAIREYFEQVPLTLKNIVLKEGVDPVYLVSGDEPTYGSCFEGLSNIRIFTETEKIDTQWAHDCPNWNNGNPVYYGGKWQYSEFRNRDGVLIDYGFYTPNQVIHTPPAESIEDNESVSYFAGYDINGDGKADFIPATSATDIKAEAIYETHRPSEWIVVKEATCEKDGYGHVVCLDCGKEIEGRVIPATGHAKGEFIRSEAPSCTECGYDIYRCKTCGEEYGIETLPATGHAFGEWIVDKAPGCRECGTRYRICSVCGMREEEVIDAKGHEYVSEITKEATCSEYGEVKYTCSVCGHEIREKIPMKPHNYEKKHVRKSWLAYLIDHILNLLFGYEGDDAYYFECVDCHHIMLREENATSSGEASAASVCAHETGDWQVISEPTGYRDGLIGRVCSKCGEIIEARTIEHTPDGSDKLRLNGGSKYTADGAKAEISGLDANDGIETVVSNFDNLSEAVRILGRNGDEITDNAVMIPIGGKIELIYEGIVYDALTVSGTFGDSNGDGKVNGKDITRIAKYIAEYDFAAGASSVGVNTGADANDDGKVNGKDITRLAKYIANFDYETGESTTVLGPAR